MGRGAARGRRHADTCVPDETWTQRRAMHCLRGFAADPGSVILGRQGAGARLAERQPCAARPEPNAAGAGFGKSDGDGRNAYGEFAKHSPLPHSIGGA